MYALTGHTYLSGKSYQTRPQGQITHTHHHHRRCHAPATLLFVRLYNCLKKWILQIPKDYYVKIAGACENDS
jgi:hypothetical protein